MNLFITILLLMHVIGSCMPSRPYGTRYALDVTFVVFGNQPLHVVPWGLSVLPSDPLGNTLDPWYMYVLCCYYSHDGYKKSQHAGHINSSLSSIIL